MNNAIFMESERLKFERMSQADFDEVKRMLGDAEVMYAWERAFTDDEIRAWIDRQLDGYSQYGYDYFLAREKTGGAVVGQIGLLRETIDGTEAVGVGWILNKAYRGKGYATEGGGRCIQYAFEVLGASKVVADIRPENLPSVRVAERLGMEKAGRFIKTVDGKQMLHILYEKSAEPT